MDRKVEGERPPEYKKNISELGKDKVTKKESNWISTYIPVAGTEPLKEYLGEGK